MDPKIFIKIKEKFRLLTDREVLGEYQKILKKLDMTPEDVNIVKINEYLETLEPIKKK